MYRSSPYDRANLIADFDSIRISLASPEKITGASVEWVCRRAAYAAVQRAIAADGDGKKKRVPGITLTRADFQSGLRELANERYRG